MNFLNRMLNQNYQHYKNNQQQNESIGYFRNSSKIAKNINLKDLRFVAIDLETTGFGTKNNQVISIGAVVIENEKINEKETYYELVNPQKDIPKAITCLTGINEQMIKDKPSLEEILPSFFSWIGDSILVGHVIDFDLAFINSCLQKNGLVKINNKTFDTRELIILLHPHLVNCELEEICAYLGLEVQGRHNALGDAIMSARIFAYAIGEFSAQGIHTLGELETSLRNRHFIHPTFTYLGI